MPEPNASPQTRNRKPTTGLWRWMEQYDCDLDTLADLVGTSRQHLSDIRRGVRHPGDPLKLRIEAATRTFARERRGDPDATGYLATEWLTPTVIRRLTRRIRASRAKGQANRAKGGAA